MVGFLKNMLHNSLFRRTLRFFASFGLLRYIWYCILYPVTYIVACLGKANLCLLTIDKVGTIKLVSIGTHASNSNNKLFIDFTRQALALIQRYDRRRMRVIEREIKYITKQEFTQGAYYNSLIQECLINFTQYQHLLDKNPHHYEWYLAHYASVIIHEATHGRLDSLGFPYSPATRARIERICWMEQKRFSSRLPSDRYDFSNDLIPPFQESDWHNYWHLSRWQRAKELLDYLRRMWQEPIKPSDK